MSVQHSLSFLFFLFSFFFFFLQIELEDRVSESSTGKGSAKGSKAKLPPGAQHRWVGLARMMERFLSNWDVLETFYRDSLELAFPLANRKDEVIVYPFETSRCIPLYPEIQGYFSFSIRVFAENFGVGLGFL